MKIKGKKINSEIEKLRQDFPTLIDKLSKKSNLPKQDYLKINKIQILIQSLLRELQRDDK